MTYFIGPAFGTYAKTIAAYTAIMAGICSIMALWSFKDLKAIAGPSTEYFRLLGLADPAGVNLNNHIHFYECLRECRARGEEPPASWYSSRPYQYRNIYSLGAAIKAGKAKLNPDAR